MTALTLIVCVHVCVCVWLLWKKDLMEWLFSCNSQVDDCHIWCCHFAHYAFQGKLYLPHFWCVCGVGSGVNNQKWSASLEQINSVKHSWDEEALTGHHRAKLMVVAAEVTGGKGRKKKNPHHHFALLYDMNRLLGVVFIFLLCRFRDEPESETRRRRRKAPCHPVTRVTEHLRFYNPRRGHFYSVFLFLQSFSYQVGFEKRLAKLLSVRDYVILRNTNTHRRWNSKSHELLETYVSVTFFSLLHSMQDCFLKDILSTKAAPSLSHKSVCVADKRRTRKASQCTLSSFTLPPSSSRFVAIIENNLQYNLVCSFLKPSDNISEDHELNGSREGGVMGWGGHGGARMGKEREAVALLFFMRTSKNTGVYDQLPGCLDQRIY